MRDIHRVGDQKDRDDSPSSSSRQSERGLFKSLYTQVNIKDFQDQLLRWSIVDHIPFSKVDSVEFKKLIGIGMPSLTVPMSRNSLRNWAGEQFAIEKDKVKAILQASASKIHLTFDGWTSPNGKAITAVVAHFVQPTPGGYRNQALLLGMKRMKGRHGGREIGQVLVDIVKDYEFGHMLGVFNCDNVSANDEAIRYALSVLDPAERDPSSRRARCIGHIINLAAKDFLFGKNIDEFELDIAGEEQSVNDSVKMRIIQDRWRRRGPIGKLHNIIAFIRSSPQRRAAFEGVKVNVHNVDGKYADINPALYCNNHCNNH